MFWYYLALAGSIFLNIVGQMILRTGVELTGTVGQQLLHPLTMVGFLNYGVAGMCYIVAIKRIPISMAFPTASISYIAVAILGHFIWNEPFGFAQLGGLVLISCGVYLLYQ